MHPIEKDLVLLSIVPQDLIAPDTELLLYFKDKNQVSFIGSVLYKEYKNWTIGVKYKVSGRIYKIDYPNIYFHIECIN